MIADVYVGLSDEEALRLAQRHNLNSHLVHRVTQKDLMLNASLRQHVENCMDIGRGMLSYTVSDGRERYGHGNTTAISSLEGIVQKSNHS